MLVDDSAIIRGLVSRALKEADDITIVGTATDGEQAIALVESYNPDVIVLDIEMPVMDGIAALPQLLKRAPNAHVIMASTLTERNAEISLHALSLGASDYLTKPSAKEADATEQFFRDLIEKIRSLALAKREAPAHNKPEVKTEQLPEISATCRPVRHVSAIAIASSTGGPQALQTVLSQLKDRARRVPVFITQHMPPTFTTLLATQLGKVSGIPCYEAKDGQQVEAGNIYLAPGDFHMLAERVASSVVIRLNQNPPENFCRPAADPMIKSLSSIYTSELLVVVLTGMGKDGLEGAKYAVKAGAEVVAQDQASSVVWGMPRAVTEAQIVTRALPLNDIADYLAEAARR